MKYTIISRLLKFNVVFLLLSICTPLCAQYSIIDSYLSKLNTQVTNATKEDQRTELLNKIFTINKVNTFFNQTISQKQIPFSCDYANPYLCTIIDNIIKPTTDLGLVILTNLLSQPLESPSDTRYIAMQKIITYFLENEEAAETLTKQFSQLNQNISEIFIQNIIDQWVMFITQDKHLSTWGKIKSWLSQQRESADYVFNNWYFKLYNRSLCMKAAYYALWGIAGITGYLPWCGLLSSFFSYCGQGPSLIANSLDGILTIARPLHLNYNYSIRPFLPQNQTRDKVFSIMNEFLQQLRTLTTQLAPIGTLLPTTMTLTIQETFQEGHEGLCSIANILKTLGYIDCCLTLTQAIKAGNILPVQLFNPSQTSIPVGTKILAALSAGSKMIAQTWHKPTKSLVISAQKHPYVSLNVLINLILAQTLGVIQIHKQHHHTIYKAPKLPFIRPQQIIVTTTSAYKANKKYEKLNTISIR